MTSQRVAGLGIDASVLETAFLQAPVGVGVCDRDGRFIAVNTALAHLLGRPAARIVGRPFLTFVHPQERAASLAAYFESVVAAASAPIRRAAHAELRCLTGDGDVVWLAVSWIITAPDDAGDQVGIVHLTDVTERREVERQLGRAQQRFELAFEHAPIGIAVVGADGRMLQVNRALQTMLGYQGTELLQRGFVEICHPDERPDALALLQQLVRGEVDVHESLRRYLHRDGHIIRARRVVAAARQPDGQIDHLLVQVENITAQRRSRPPLRAPRDGVTGLATRKVLALQLELSANIPRSLVLVQLPDLPHLTATPDGESEQLLAHVAAVLTRCSRNGDLVARVDAREFAIVVEDADANTGPALANRVRGALANPIVTEHGTTTLTVLVRVASDPAGTRHLDGLLHEARHPATPIPASAGLRRAASRRPSSGHGDSLTASARDLALQADLDRALHEQDLRLVYQPIIALADGSMRSVEALSRWRHPALGPVAPAEFIAIAERGPAIHTLTQWALQTACADLAVWQARYPAAAQLSVAVNVSVQSFEMLDFPQQVADCLATTGLDPQHLILEITESAAAESATSFIDNAARLRGLGIGIALDDFGTGHSSLARIARLPLTELKLDQSLIGPASNEATAAAVLRAVVNLTADLGLGLVAEGVETPGQLELLYRCHCPHAQGNLLAPAQSPARITDNLSSR
jgi:PAS domain S-box-containing protein